MAEATDAKYRHQIARSRPALAQGVERRDAGAQQRRRVDGRELVGDERQRVGRGHHGLGVAAVIGDAGDPQIAAVDEIATTARLAPAAVASEPANSDARADAPPDN